MRHRTFLVSITVLTELSDDLAGEIGQLLAARMGQPTERGDWVDLAGGSNPPDLAQAVMQLQDYFPQLRAWLDERRIPATELAEAAGIAPTQLSRYLHGNVDARLSTIEKIEAGREKLAKSGRK